MASRIEIATDAVDLVVTDCDVLTAPRTSGRLWTRSIERAAAGSEGALSGDSWVSRFLGEVWVDERG
jgi:hypothetical protein